MLLAQKSYVEGALALGLYCSTLVDEQRTAPDEDSPVACGASAGLLTPIAKSWPSQWCLEANSLAIQVLGGYGYTREFDVEQYYRDNRLNPIHEGTHGIQGMDLLGRKVIMQGGAALGVLGDHRRDRDEGADAGGDAAEYAQQLQRAVVRVGDDHRPVVDRRSGCRAGKLDRLPRSGRACGGRVDLARTTPRRGRAGRRVLRRQARGGPVLLPIRTSEDGAAVRSAREPRPHHPGRRPRAGSEPQPSNPSPRTPAPQPAGFQLPWKPAGTRAGRCTGGDVLEGLGVQQHEVAGAARPVEHVAHQHAVRLLGRAVVGHEAELAGLTTGARGGARVDPAARSWRSTGSPGRPSSKPTE